MTLPGPSPIEGGGSERVAGFPGKAPSLQLVVVQLAVGLPDNKRRSTKHKKVIKDECRTTTLGAGWDGMVGRLS